MIHQLDSSVASILATYFSVLDLSSLSQVSPNLRYLFIQYSWRRVFVIPHIYLNHGTDKAFKMYEYQVISVEMLTELVKYQWIKRNCVQELVLSPMCVWTENSIIDQIDIGNYFPYLQSIYSESHHTIEQKEVIYFEPSHHRYIIGMYSQLFLQQKSLSAFTDKVISTAPKRIKIVNLSCESQLQLYSISNLEMLTSLQVSFVNPGSSCQELTNHLKRCINVQRFIFTPLIVLSISQYSLIYSVINNSFSKLKFLKLLHHYGDGKLSNPYSNINTVEKLWNKNIKYFEVYVILRTGNKIDNHLHQHDNGGSINLSGVHGLEFGASSPIDMNSFRYPVFCRKIHAPDLMHFKLNNFVFGRYLEHMLIPVKNNLVTLYVGLAENLDLSSFISALPKFCNLKNLVVERVHDPVYYEWNIPYSLIELKFRFIGRIYDWVYSNIRDGNIEIDEIRQLSDEAVEKLIVDILINGEIDLQTENYEEFVKTMTMMIKHPESVVKHYESKLKLPYSHIGVETLLYKIKIVPYIYSFWDSVFNTCKDLTKLEVLKIFHASVPFVSPHFNNLIHNHKSSRLKHITIGIARACSKFIPSTELSELSYERYLYRVKEPFVHRYLEPYMRCIDYVGDVYVVDVESMNNDFKSVKRFREEEMKHSQGYLDSTFNDESFADHHECLKTPRKDVRILTIDSREIQNLNTNLGHM